MGTSTVYPGSFGDAGHEFVVTAVSRLPHAHYSRLGNRCRAQVDQKTHGRRYHCRLQRRGESCEADSVGTYRLAMPGKKKSFTAKNATVVKLKSAVFDAGRDEVTLTPKKALR